MSTVGQFEGAVKTDQAAIASAKLQITYCHITAPFSGRIGLRLVDMGNFVQAAGQTPSGRHHSAPADRGHLSRSAG